METTAYDILIEVDLLVKDAETRALMGERVNALCCIRQASELYDEFQDVLLPFSDARIIRKRIDSIARQLCAELNAWE